MIDLHAHTTASDGQHAPSELVRRAHAAGVRTLAVTDHDTLAGIAEAQAAAAALGVSIVVGIEVSTVLGDHDIHILGHFVRPGDEPLARFIARQGGERRRRMEGMVERMNALGYPVRMQHVEAIAQSENFCRPHLARVLVELGYCSSTQDAFSRFLSDDGPAFVAQERIEAKDAIALLHAAGGTASLAHPAADGMDRYQIAQLREAGLDGLEVFHSDHNPSVREKYLKIADALGLVATAGSDFHGEAVSPNARLGTVGLDPARFEALRSRASSQREA